jgi:acyl carrier protein
MSDRAVPPADAVRRVILRRLSSPPSADALLDHVLLADVPGLDSIGVIEVLFDCDEEFRVTVCDALLEQGSITVGSLVEAIAQASGHERPA